VPRVACGWHRTRNVRRILALATAVGGLLGLGALGGCFGLAVEDCVVECTERSDCPRDYSCNQGLCAANTATVCQAAVDPDPDPEPVPVTAPDAGDPTATDAGPGAGADAMPAADASPCLEAACVPVSGAHVSHYTGPDCTGTESYYTPYFTTTMPPMPNPDGRRYSWDGRGLAGSEYRTVTNRSYRNTLGVCTNAWPLGNTLEWFVTIYR
jgi:hypothetical protein